MSEGDVEGVHTKEEWRGRREGEGGEIGEGAEQGGARRQDV